MSDMTRLELPFPPSVNTTWRRAGKRLYVNPKVATFRDDVRKAVQKASIKSFGSERLKVAITLHAPTNRKYDIDNRAKAILDALQKASLFEDDEQIDELVMKRGEVRKNNALCIVDICSLSHV